MFVLSSCLDVESFDNVTFLRKTLTKYYTRKAILLLYPYFGFRKMGVNSTMTKLDVHVFYTKTDFYLCRYCSLPSYGKMKFIWRVNENSSQKHFSY